MLALFNVSSELNPAPRQIGDYYFFGPLEEENLVAFLATAFFTAGDPNWDARALASAAWEASGIGYDPGPGALLGTAKSNLGRARRSAMDSLAILLLTEVEDVLNLVSYVLHAFYHFMGTEGSERQPGTNCDNRYTRHWFNSSLNLTTSAGERRMEAVVPGQLHFALTSFRTVTVTAPDG